MNTIVKLIGIGVLALPLSLAAQDRPVDKPFEITAGAIFWQDDHQDTLDIDTGFIGGIDYYWRGNQSVMYGVGVRGLFGSGSGNDSTTVGGHLVLRGAFSQVPGPAAGLFYKITAGLYWTEIDPATGSTDDEFGFGGSASIGYDFSATGGAASTPFSIEVGWFIGPEVNGIDNNGPFALAGIRF